MLNQTDLSRVDLNLLVLFEVVFEERHVGRSADRLSLSPSAVSHGLGRLRTLLNDPLFIRTPRGVRPNERAIALAPAISGLLDKVREVVADSVPFDPATSTRRYVIGAPDGVSAVFLPPLMAKLAAQAPRVDISIRHLLPKAGEMDPERAWRGAFGSLEAGTLDVAVIPWAVGPTRFARRILYQEDFVLVTRDGHPFLSRATLGNYCDSSHLVVSESGDPRGFVDEALAREGRTRRVALTAPNFMFACAIVAKTDLICAIPRRFAELYAPLFGLAASEPPFPIDEFQLHAVLPAASLADSGIAWLLEQLDDVAGKLGSAARTRPAANAGVAGMVGGDGLEPPTLSV